MTNCDFDNDDTTCPRCGFKAGGRDWRKNCLGMPSFVADVKEAASGAGLTLPLGDWTEAGLSAIGITKARVSEWTGSAGCSGCTKRQEWLNELGGKLAAFFKST
jgi:hypothetical protein